MTTKETSRHVKDSKRYRERSFDRVFEAFSKCAFPIQDTLRPELSWSHYRALMKINDEEARMFYLDETVKSGWSSRQLNRQINTFYYQRILASKDKASVASEIDTLEPKPEYEKIVKDPYVLEFLIYLLMSISMNQNWNRHLLITYKSSCLSLAEDIRL